jgi:chromosome segregation ATPase
LVTKMSTGAAIDGAVSSGVAGLRRKMKELRERIATENEKAEKAETENMAKMQHLGSQVGKYESMKYRCEDMVEDIEKFEKKFLDVEHRTLEREEFVRQSKESAGRVHIVVLDEDEVAAKQKELDEKTQQLKKNQALLQDAEARKNEVEKKSEEYDGMLADFERTLHKLKIELEYNTIEENRRSKTSKASIEMAFNTEKACKDLQRGLDVIMRRKSEATRKTNDLELRIHKAEDAYEAVAFERRRIEAAIREILLSSVRKL